MANDLTDLASFLDDDSIHTPLIKSRAYPNGKTYHIPSPDFETGLWLNSIANIATRSATGAPIGDTEVAKIKMDDDGERSFMQKVLGAVYDEFQEDGVSWVVMQRITQYAFAYFAMSPQAAAKGIETGAFLGKASAPANRAERRSSGAKSDRPASTGSKSPKKAKV